MAGRARNASCRRLSADRLSEASFYLWKKKYGKRGLTELSELRQLCDENTHLNRLVAYLTLNKPILREVDRTLEAASL